MLLYVIYGNVDSTFENHLKQHSLSDGRTAFSARHCQIYSIKKLLSLTNTIQNKTLKTPHWATSGSLKTH